MPISLSQAQTALQNWIEADAAVSKGQSYSIAGRSLSRVNAEEIRAQIDYWSRIEAQLLRVANGKSRVSVQLARFNRNL